MTSAEFGHSGGMDVAALLELFGPEIARRKRLQGELERSIEEQAADYLADCEAKQSPGNVREKRRHLTRLIEEEGIGSLGELDAEVLRRNMERLVAAGRSARTCNFRRQATLAFANWCVRVGRLERHEVGQVQKLDEDADRRYVRRALTDDEISRLLEATAESPERRAWYACAYFAGMRKGELMRLEWSDVDLEEGVLQVTNAKGKRKDSVPIMPRLAEALAAVWPLVVHSSMTPEGKVFQRAVSDRRRREDFERAGIAMVDDRGRHADLHGLRTTLGTHLARAGVNRDVRQRVMRHRNFETTDKHYTALEVDDQRDALARLVPVDRGGPRTDPPEDGDQGPIPFAPASIDRWLAACPVPLDPEQRRRIAELATQSDEEVA